MLDLYKARMANYGTGQAQAYLRNADMIIDKTFTRDPAYRVVYVTHAPSDMYDVKYDAKFFINTRRSMSGDSEDYALQLRPHVRIPIGSYVDIPDDAGELQRWLVILKDDQPQFPIYYVLKCNWWLKWKIGDKVFKCQCVQRTQSSYNSGLWFDFHFNTPENQTIMLAPTTPYVQTLSYGRRVLINDVGRVVPLAWQVSKMMDTIPVGLTRLTFAQEQATIPEDCGIYGIANLCPHKEHNGLKSELCANCKFAEPKYIDAGLEMPVPEKPKGRISYAGKETLRVGGSSKLLTAESWDGVNFVPYNAFWRITCDSCVINARFNGVAWEINSAVAGFDIEINNGDVRCFIDKQDICQFKIAGDNYTLKLGCGQLYSMVGKQIKIEAQDSNGENRAETTLEVIS
jgi:hypothetical protein